MTVDEALDLVEMALDYQHLNKVQELVFRQAWEGQSYKQIAGISEYEYDYIKDVGAKLWKLLSEAFGEKVKKDNLQPALKRYLRRNKVSFHRNQMIEVNLSGANLSGASLSLANLSVEKPLLTNLSEPNSFIVDLQKAVIPDNKTESIENSHNQGLESNPQEQVYHWHGLRFRSEAEVKIAEALDRAGVLFFPNSKARITTTEGRENQEPDFLIFQNGKWGILEVDGEIDDERDRILQSHGIGIIQHYDSTACSEQPDLVIQEFLAILNRP